MRQWICSLNPGQFLFLNLFLIKSKLFLFVIRLFQVLIEAQGIVETDRCFIRNISNLD